MLRHRQTDFEATCMWFSVILGSALAIWALLSALGKLFPFCLKGKYFQYGFDNVWGPYMVGENNACKACLKYLTAIWELAAGVVLVVGLWMDPYGGTWEFPGAGLKPWLLAFPCGMAFGYGAALVMHFKLDHNKPTFRGMIILFILAFTVTVLRVLAWPPWHMLAPNQWMVIILGILLPWPFLVCACMAWRNEVGLEKLDEDNEALREM